MLVRITLDLLNCAVQEMAQLRNPPTRINGQHSGPRNYPGPAGGSVRLGPFLTGRGDYRRFSIPLILRLISPVTPDPPAVRPADVP